MLKNLITVALRNLLRQKGSAIINLLGLTIGLTTGALIIIYIVHELGYDRFHENANRIYRIAVKGEISGQQLNVALSSPPFGPALQADYPEVIDYARIDQAGSNSLFAMGDLNYYEEDILFADSSFFNLFSVPMIHGDPKTALKNPNSIVLSETMSARYFGDDNPVGASLRFNDQTDLKVTGVCEDYPDNSHFQFNSLISFSTFRELRGEQWFDDWGSLSMYTYILLGQNASADSLALKLPGFLNTYISEEIIESSVQLEPYLQPLTSIHLHSDLMAEIGNNSDMNYIYLMIAITVFILILASINFMNLSTAKSANRAREVGMRKVVGSSRKNLIIQFIGESVLISLFSLCITFFLLELILPVFNSITGKSLSMAYILNWKLFLGFLLLAVLVGIMAGSYPAFYLSSFNPIRVLQGRLKAGTSGSRLRNILVFIQFSVSIALIIGTLIVYLQLQYVQQKDLGFEKENVVIITFRNQKTRQTGQALKTEVLKIPDVIGASLSSSYPGGELSGTGFYPEGYKDTEPWLIYGYAADPDFVDSTLKMSIIKGRNFSCDVTGDSMSILINETLWRMLGWENPICRIIEADPADSLQYRIVGVLKDFHNQSLHQQINPVMIRFLDDLPEYLLVRIEPGKSDRALAQLQDQWEKVNTEMPFDYNFLNDRITRFYDYEKKIGKILVYFTIFALFIASLGLFGLASFVSEQRTKEIGIRKVLGSSLSQISLILSLEFMKPVLLANLIAWLEAWFAMRRWLQEFQYRIEMPYWVFAAAGFLALMIALVTVNIQTYRAASAKPVTALRYE